MSFYLYGETAFHHEGDINYLYRLIDLAKETGLHGIKFQVLIKPEQLIATTHNLFPKFLTWVFSKQQWLEIFSYCSKLELDVIVMPLDKEAFDVVAQSKIKYLDLHSVSFYDEVVLEKLKQTRLPIILGIGGRTIAEVSEKVSFFSGQEIILMMGFQAFPSELPDVKLPRIKKLKELFPTTTIGYTDHTLHSDEYGIYSNEYSYLLGARVFEKHIACDEGVQRIDFEAAVGKEKLIDLRNRLEYLDWLIDIDEEVALSFTTAEVKYRNREKVFVAIEKLQKGTLITAEMLVKKMTDKQDGVNDPALLIGKKLISDIEKDEVISLSLVGL